MMLQTPHAALVEQPAEGVRSAGFYADLRGFLARQWTLVAAAALACLGLAILYVISAPPSYTAQATMIIDTRKVSLFQQPSIVGDLPVDSATVESQVEILRSENVALAVIKDLRLTDDAEFTASSGGLLGQAYEALQRWFGAGAALSDYDLRRRAAETFASRLTVKRTGLTYIIEVGYRSLDRERAAQIANAVVEAYIVDQLDAKFRATQRASIWLQERIRELRDQVTNAEQAVVDFKQKNNIVNTGGRLMDEQQVGELNSQLVASRGQTGEMRARLERIEEIIRAGAPEATVTDTLRSEVVTKLRQQYLELKGREADWAKRYGAFHLAVVNLRNQMAEIRRSILDELRRLAETFKSDYEIARQRELAMEQSVADAVVKSQATSQAQVALRQLESSAQSYRTLYDNFLQRYMESVQQQTFPVTEARVITAATPPLQKSHPKTALVLLIASTLGLGLGFGLGRLRDLADRTFRSSRQVASMLQVNCIGVLPLLTVPPRVETGEVPSPSSRSIATAGLIREVVDSPFSRYAESLRSVKTAIDLGSPGPACKVVGVTSALPNEGKSTTAASLAQLIAQSGARVLLVDGDLRNPSLTRAVAPRAAKGLIEAAAGEELEGLRWSDGPTSLHFLPAVLQNRTAHTSEILGAEAVRALFARMRSSYDYIILDLSPLAPVVDVRRTSDLVDCYVLVVEWGRTDVEFVRQALSEAPKVYENLIGVVLNKTRMNAMRRYEGYTEGYYANRYYSRYLYGGKPT